MIPSEYDFLNIYSGTQRPGTVHASDNATAAFFRRYFMQKCVSVFDMECPEEWPKNYFWYVLYGCGYIGITEIPGYGVIPQYCTLAGRNVFYQPAEILISNPAIKGPAVRRTIDKDCVLLKLTPDYCGIIDLIGKYADLMAVTAEALGINVLNSKLSYVFASKNKAAAETFKKMFDNIQSGQPAQFVDKDLFDPETGEPSWMTFAEDLHANFIAPDLLAVWDDLEHKFEQEIGIPNTAGVQKKERLVVDEVNMNNNSTYSKASLWLESLKEGAAKVKQMFGIDLSFRFRMEGNGNAGNAVNTGLISNKSESI